ncbi:MAG: aromatic ring-hydroxylating dioxygenase subunit alpha [Pseudomonadota bacterium]
MEAKTPAITTALDNPTPQLTLPSRCFTDPDVYAQELTSIFSKVWQPVGHSVDVAKPGSYITGNVAGQDIAVIRGRDGTLRGFFNVCQHRGHRLLKGKGDLKIAITCPYHAWAYGLDGRLRGAPNAENVPGFDASRVGLKEIGVEEIGKLVLVNLDTDAASFEDEFPGVAKELAEFAPRLDELEFAHRTTAEMACNWKVAFENYAECYHCTHAHPTLMTALLSADGFKLELFEKHHRQTTGTAKGGVTLYQIDRAASPHVDELRSWVLWPNFALQVNPGSNYVVFHFIPDGPERAIAQIDWFFGPWVDAGERERIVAEHSATTLAEDVRLVTDVQIGLNNMGYDRGVIMADGHEPDAGRSEHSVAHLQNLWRRAMGGDW